MLCVNCGLQNDAAARFCQACGGPLGRESGERRTVVTVLFCDVVDSTALAESMDAETLRALLARYFQRMRTVIEQHGGSVEKFIGDAVMAAFGVPAVHEDDALRACHAAVEMRSLFPELGLQGRIGVSTGEVVTGTRERLATGDALNVAARLQQAAAPGEVLIAEATRRLAASGVDVEPIGPLLLKGKREPSIAFRLIDARPAVDRRHDTPFVGRRSEIALVVDEWRRSLSDRTARMVTVVGEPGIGKSRLVAEAVSKISGTVVRGRCLPYGAGVTYWPVVEVIKQVGASPSIPEAAAAIDSLLASDALVSAEEIDWAFRKLLEEQAPLVVVFDDLQWGAETFLDLVEHVGGLSRDAPILLLCMARPELLERRPEWPVSVSLEPLSHDDAMTLIGDMDEVIRARIADAAGGNPLFIGEMLAIASERGGVTDVPPTLRALLASRLDRLGTNERGVLQRGAVEGEVFHRGAVQALGADPDDVSRLLGSLAGRGLIHPASAIFDGDQAYRFHHLLMRDTAYEALSKSSRAAMHERFADWVEHRAGQLVELDEVAGYHLEQTTRYLGELGSPDASIAERAGARLAIAGRRAYWRGDDRSASGLLERALRLTRALHLDVVLEVDLAVALFFQDGARAVKVADAAAERARAAGDRSGELLARVSAIYIDAVFSDDPDFPELERLAREAVPALQREQNHAGLVHVWYALGFGVANHVGCFNDHARASERAIVEARLAGQQSSRLFYLEDALALGPLPADEALATLDQYLPANPHPSTLVKRAWFLTMLGRQYEAAAIIEQAEGRYRDLTGDDTADVYLGMIAAAAGRHQDAAAHLRRFCDQLEALGQRGYLSSFAPMLGRSLCLLGRYEEAEPLARLGRELGDDQDALTQTLWRQVQALVEEHHGHFDHAERLAREAVAVTETTDSLNWQGDALWDLAEVLHDAGHDDEAAATFDRALERYERKRNWSKATQLATRRAELHAAAGSRRWPTRPP